MPRLRFVTATELRDRLREHIRRLGSDPIVIARHGRAVAVMLSVREWDRIQDEIDARAAAKDAAEHNASNANANAESNANTPAANQ